MSTNPAGDKSFIEITNADIYRELLDIKQHVMKTNGKVKLNRWIATTALTMSGSLVTVMIILIGVLNK